MNFDMIIVIIYKNSIYLSLCNPNDFPGQFNGKSDLGHSIFQVVKNFRNKVEYRPDSHMTSGFQDEPEIIE